jgi:hypothetical protein
MLVGAGYDVPQWQNQLLFALQANCQLMPRNIGMGCRKACL